MEKETDARLKWVVGEKTNQWLISRAKDPTGIRELICSNKTETIEVQGYEPADIEALRGPMAEVVHKLVAEDKW